MYRVSLIISEIYSKYLPLADKANIRLDLDIADQSQAIDNADELKHDIESHLQSALKRAPRGEIKISLKPGQLIICDNGTTLSPAVCALLSHGRIKVRSRVGFGTKIEFNLTKPTEDQPTIPQIPQK